MYDSFVNSADGMMFGALKGCPNCKSPMEFREESYKCRGIIADGFPCTFTTLKARRIDVNDYMIGEAYNNPYLIQVKALIAYFGDYTY
jgi:hypothetical protein